MLLDAEVDSLVDIKTALGVPLYGTHQNAPAKAQK